MKCYERNMPWAPPLRETYQMRYIGSECKVPVVSHPEEYQGQSEIRFACTQHAFVSDLEQRKITDKWVSFLKNHTLPVDKVVFCTRMPQDVFDAVCCQESITELYIKWCAAPDLANIAKLKNLQKLYIGHGAMVRSVEPLAALRNLEALRLGNTTKITDYSPLGKLYNLRELSIEGNDKLTPVILHMESDAFLQELSKLEYLNLYSVEVQNRSFLYQETTGNISSILFRL